MTSKQSSKHPGRNLEGDIDARFDEKETAADTSSTTTAALASPTPTKQPRPLREGGIKRLCMIEGWSKDYYSFKCFVLDLEKGEETTLTISPASDEDRVAVHFNFAVVALGSIIYMIGGNCMPGFGYHPHQHVRYFDTLEPEKGWKLGVPMHSGRTKPAAAVVDGKIYVFGGLLNNATGYDAEFFDPKTNKWIPLTVLGYEPTAYPQTQVPYVRTDGTKRILIISHMTGLSLYEYHLNEHKWRVLDRNCDDCRNQGAYLDHILYSVFDDSENPLCGFDLIRKKWFPVKLPQLDDGITIYFRYASV